MELLNRQSWSWQMTNNNSYFILFNPFEFYLFSLTNCTETDTKKLNTNSDIMHFCLFISK